jgi:hypothetical protein
MAKRAPLIARKSKAQRVTRSESYLVNRKYLGDEPELKDDYTNIQFSNALTWYNYMCTSAEAKEYIKDYLKSKGRSAELKSFNRVPDSWVPVTAAWVARIMTRGTTVKPDTIRFFESKLAECLKKSVVVVEEVNQPEKVVVSVQDRIREKASDLIGDIEELLDKGEAFSMYEFLQKNEVPAIYAPMIVNHYAPWLGELLEASEGEDEQLKEAYRHLTKKQLNARIVFFNSLIEDAERYGNNTKKTRAPRKPRAVSVEKKLKNLKFQKEDKEFKIASINPEKIIGAWELWTFNTKYKTLTVLRAIDRGGLQVKGTSIINYDEKNSFTKRTGRKPEEYVKKTLDGGKLVLRKVMDGLKDAPLAYRINENTILLRITA